MIDHEAIGRRIAEERRFGKSMSQEALAAALGIYQADVSNLERGRKGSGISDIDRLDQIAGVLGIPIQELLFGRENGARMEKYLGSRMTLKASKAKVPARHRSLLERLAGRSLDHIGVASFKCGPYAVYQLVSEHVPMLDVADIPYEGFRIVRSHLYTVFEDRVIAALSTIVVNIFSLMNQGIAHALQLSIPMHVLDVTDPMRTLLPHLPLMRFAANETERERFEKGLWARMQELRPLKEMPVLLVEGVYVREECRRQGMLRLLLDTLDAAFGEHVTWMNMEPPTGDQLEGASHSPVYTPAQVGQLHINAAIAEKLGLTVDVDTWARDVVREGEDGGAVIEEIQVNKCSFKLPRAIRKILKDDGNLVALGRARQVLMAEAGREEKLPETVSSRHSMVDGRIVVEVCRRKGNGRIRICSFAVADDVKLSNLWLGVSRYSPLEINLDIELSERYGSLQEARTSEMADDLRSAYVLLSRLVRTDAYLPMPQACVRARVLHGKDGVILRGLRWASDGGFVSECGQGFVQAVNYCEIEAVCDGTPTYICVTASNRDGYVQVIRSTRSVFDLLVGLPKSADWRRDLDAVHSMAESLDIYGSVEEVGVAPDNPMQRLERFALIALSHYEDHEFCEDEQSIAAAFMKPFLGEDIMEIELPERRVKVSGQGSPEIPDACTVAVSASDAGSLPVTDVLKSVAGGVGDLGGSPLVVNVDIPEETSATLEDCLLHSPRDAARDMLSFVGEGYVLGDIRVLDTSLEELRGSQTPASRALEEKYLGILLNKAAECGWLEKTQPVETPALARLPLPLILRTCPRLDSQGNRALNANHAVFVHTFCLGAVHAGLWLDTPGLLKSEDALENTARHPLPRAFQSIWDAVRKGRDAVDDLFSHLLDDEVVMYSLREAADLDAEDFLRACLGATYRLGVTLVLANRGTSPSSAHRK